MKSPQQIAAENKYKTVAVNYPIHEDYNKIVQLQREAFIAGMQASALDAMNFVCFCSDQRYIYMGGGEWFHDMIGEPISRRSTTEQLYNLFKQDK